MYYPIIDKLKKVMADITAVKDKEPLIIEGTFTGQTSGIWKGNYSDVVTAFNNKKPIYFSAATPTETFLFPIIQVGSSDAMSCLFAIGSSPARGLLSNNNTFTIFII